MPVGICRHRRPRQQNKHLSTLFCHGQRGYIDLEGRVVIDLSANRNQPGASFGENP